MILFISKHLATSQVDEGFREGHNDWDSRLEFFLVWFECHRAVSKHDSARFHIANRVHIIFDLELANALVTRLHSIFRLIWSILFEFSREAHAWVSDNQILEYDVVVRFQLDSNNGTLVADNVNLFFDVSLLDDYARFCDRVGASIDTLHEVDCSKWFYTIESLL